MIYPYTIISKDKVEEFYELLKSFGYTAFLILNNL